MSYQCSFQSVIQRSAAQHSIPIIIHCTTLGRLSLLDIMPLLCAINYILTHPRCLDGLTLQASPNASNASFDVTITAAAAAAPAATATTTQRQQQQPYRLTLYAVDFGGDGCSCLVPPACCRGPGAPSADCSKPAGGGRIQSVEVLHAATNASAAPMQVLSDFEGGVYMRCKRRGRGW